MKLNKISLKNIRSHKNSEIKFKDGINTLTGPTGSGKTSFLLAIEYCLFGSHSVSNSAILRRGSKKGRIELGFSHKGNDYRIIRGLERKGDSVLTDNSSLEIYKNREKLSFFRRVGDFNQKILGILGYPESVDPKKLFEVTTYTKQNEIRKLTESRGEKRQKYIDKVLQLSKYRETWEALRSIIRGFENEKERLGGKIENIKAKKKEIAELRSEIKKDREKLEKNKERCENTREKIEDLGKEIEKVEKRKDRLREDREKYEEYNTILDQKKEELNEYEAEMEALKTRIERIDDEIGEGKLKDLEKIRTRKGELKQKREAFKQDIKDMRLKLEEVLGGETGGNCPLCGKPLGEGGVKKLREHFKSEIESREEKLSEVKNKLKEVGKEIEDLKEMKELQEEKEKREERSRDVKKKIKGLNEQIEERKKEISSLKSKKEKFMKIKEGLSDLKQDKHELEKRKEALREKIKMLERSIQRSKDKKKKRKEELEELKEAKEEYDKLKDTCSTLEKLRDDVRGIRKVVRRKFLREFEQEFQRLFKKIRKEGEYVVNVEEDYEPKAFTSEGQEVEIENLSGGEKTSVGLAYRLALSKIAASIGGITPPEFLMLDEPTTGFDRSDIKNLIEILRRLDSIPQIVVVSHEGEIKNAADYSYEIRKESGVSRIEKVR